MSKFGTFRDYPKESLQSAEAALLAAWRSLDRYHNDLVLVGGLAVHYLTKHDAAGEPRAWQTDPETGGAGRGSPQLVAGNPQQTSGPSQLQFS